MPDKMLITDTELNAIEEKASRFPNHDGKLTPVIVRLFIEHMAVEWGIDLDIETEEMKNERESKENRSKSGGGMRLGRKSFHGPSDD